jgi:phosphoenolpyruvate phosphomutase
MKKKVYIGLSLDIIHHGHINLINKAKKYGYVIVGLLSDTAIASQKKLPLLNYSQRKKILSSINGIDKIVEQKEWCYSSNILKYKPDIMLHGDDWKADERGRLLKKKAIDALKKIGSKLIEIPHTKGISSTSLQKQFHEEAQLPIKSGEYLKRLIKSKDITRIIETHSPLSALIAENVSYSKNKIEKREFDGFWSSSLTDSTLKGKPDIEVLDLNHRLTNISDIFNVTKKPLIMDVDTGGKLEHFSINCKVIERSSVSAIIMEDKTGLKKNSLFGTEVKQKQDSIKNFSDKIKVGKKLTQSLMIISRIESLILGKTVKDALNRAEHYLAAGSDGIMIHSKSNKPNEIFQFSRKFKKLYPNIPLVSVPSSYNQVLETQLIDEGFNVVIYANHMLRASYPAMQKVAYEILKNRRSYESDKNLMSIKQILNLIPGTK